METRTPQIWRARKNDSSSRIGRTMNSRRREAKTAQTSTYNWNAQLLLNAAHSHTPLDRRAATPDPLARTPPHNAPNAACS
eukprot:8358745-Lingulodinium_polyedra.AAC.3